MQQFEDSKGERRILNIKNMKREDVAEYYLQHGELTKKQRHDKEKILREQISKSKKKHFYEWILAVKSKKGKVIGKIEVLDMGNSTAFVTINLPDGEEKNRYGVEALDQFIKICKENKYFSTIELEKNNSIVRNYIENHGNNYIVKVA